MLDDDGPKGRVTSTSTPSTAVGGQPRFTKRLVKLVVYLRHGFVGSLTTAEQALTPECETELVEAIEQTVKAGEGFLTLDLPNGKQIIPTSNIAYVEVLHA